MKQRTAFGIAWGVWAISLGTLLAPLIYRFTHGSLPGFSDQPGSWAPLVTVLLFIPAFATVGAILPEAPLEPDRLAAVGLRVVLRPRNVRHPPHPFLHERGATG